MVGFLTFLIIILILLGLGLPLVFLRVRKVFREQKNFERGLKMIPLLIHLPPQSDDADTNGRDVRDLVDENISKAQILYNIVASTFEKGFKKNFYGQRHFTFEIVGTKGFVHYYTAVPISLVEVVKQAVISAYPSARLEEVSEHNIFSPVGKLSATAGGELTLKKHYAYPIATYQDLKRDAMQSLLNALSNLDKEDGVGIQILLRPANEGWRKSASELASRKRKGTESKKGKDEFMWWVKQIPMAFVKSPEDKSGGGSDKPELSSLDQSIVDSIEEKTRYPGYEVLIRVVASSNISQKSQGILKSVLASFALFDAPGKNGFKFTPAKDIESFVTSYIMRFFPQAINQNVLNAVELATLFHFPDQSNIPTSQLERQASKQVDGPRNVPDDGLLLGYNVFRGVKKPIRLALTDRQRHMYVVGQTGTGKSTFLENVALQDMLNGDGFAFVDPHGDTAENLLAMVPKERAEDVIYFCPADMDYPMGLNLFEFYAEEQKDFLIQETLNMLYKLYDPQRQGIIGPRFERIFTNCALLLMSDPKGGTFVDVPKLLIDPDFMKEKLQYVTDQNVLDFWTKEWPNSQRSNEAGEVISWVVSKFGAFLSNEMMRNIIGQNKSSFNIREIMDQKKILLVNLSKGKTGDLNSRLLGMIFVMKFQAAAMSRADIPERDRKDFCLYVDEFQNFSTDSFATIMSEARKYRLNLVVANQFTTQLSDEIRDAVFGNMGSIVAFRVGQNDVDALTRYFQPLFDAEDLLRVPNYNTIVRTLINGVPTQPFSMAALPRLGTPNDKLAEALKELTAAKFGRPRAEVAAEISERLAVKEKPKPTFGSANPFTSGGAAQPGGLGAPAGQAAGRPQPKPPGSGSFLDEWLAKRKSPANPATVPQQRPVAPATPVSAGAPMQQSAQQVSTSATLATPAPSLQPTTANQPPTVPVPAPTIPAQTFAMPNSTAQQPQPAVASPGPAASPAYTQPLMPPANQVATPNPVVKAVVPTLPTEDTAQNLVSHSPAKEQSSDDDDIFIDNEGVLHIRRDDD
jgi:hypothetical protein